MSTMQDEGHRTPPLTNWSNLHSDVRLQTLALQLTQHNTTHTTQHTQHNTHNTTHTTQHTTHTTQFQSACTLPLAHAFCARTCLQLAAPSCLLIAMHERGHDGMEGILRQHSNNGPCLYGAPHVQQTIAKLLCMVFQNIATTASCTHSMRLHIHIDQRRDPETSANHPYCLHKAASKRYTTAQTRLWQAYLQNPLPAETSGRPQTLQWPLPPSASGLLRADARLYGQDAPFAGAALRMPPLLCMLVVRGTGGRRCAAVLFDMASLARCSGEGSGGRGRRGDAAVAGAGIGGYSFNGSRCSCTANPAMRWAAVSSGHPMAAGGCARLKSSTSACTAMLLGSAVCTAAQRAFQLAAASAVPCSKFARSSAGACGEVHGCTLSRLSACWYARRKGDSACSSFSICAASAACLAKAVCAASCSSSRALKSLPLAFCPLLACATGSSDGGRTRLAGDAPLVDKYLATLDVRALSDEGSGAAGKEGFVSPALLSASSRGAVCILPLCVVACACGACASRKSFADILPVVVAATRASALAAWRPLAACST
jgi:hypothetical protein